MYEHIECIRSEKKKKKPINPKGLKSLSWFIMP